jgi:cytoskeletal protein RodZ
MQLNEILEENTIKSMSQKTKISEENLENLLAKNFDVLIKTKTLGFISILEREYKADLNALRNEALEYYASHNDQYSVSVARVPVEEEKRGSSKIFLVFVLALLGYASWYFFTQFDNKHLRGLIPFKNEQMAQNDLAVEDVEVKENFSVEELTIESAVVNNTKVVLEEPKEENSLKEINDTDTAVTDEVNDTTVSVSEF